MTKGPDAFRTISEAAEELNVPQHVLRFWETRFTQIRPVKRGGGRRFYRPEDIALLHGIRHLLYGAGYTIRGVQRILKEQGMAHVQGLGSDALDMGTPEKVEPATPGKLGLELRDSENFEQGDGASALHFGNDSEHVEVQSSSHIACGAKESEQSAEFQLDYMPFTAPPTQKEHEATADLPSEAASQIDSVSDRYAPGPLSARHQRTFSQEKQSSFDQLIAPDYKLANSTREQLQGVVNELRECRRLLAQALNRQVD